MSKPQTKLIITVAAYSLVTVYLTSDWLLLHDTITFQKYFWCSQLSGFDSIRIIHFVYYFFFSSPVRVIYGKCGKILL